MAGFGDAIKYLYGKFILRDVLSFVTPGAIVVFTVLFLFFSKPTEVFGFVHTYWPLYIPLFGLFFMVGFVVQCLGEIFDIIRFGPRDQGTWGQRFGIFWSNWADERNIWWKEVHKNNVAFAKYIHSDEWAEQQRERLVEWAEQQQERLVVLKQMCANGAFAIAISAFLILINLWSHQAYIVLFSIVAFLLLLSLFWGYRIHELRLDTMERAIRGLPINGKKES